MKITRHKKETKTEKENTRNILEKPFENEGKNPATQQNISLLKMKCRSVQSLSLDAIYITIGETLHIITEGLLKFL